jgi:ABC-type transporter Mla subunit MlaD
MTHIKQGATWPASASQPAETKTVEQTMHEIARRYGTEEDLRRAEAISQFLVDTGEVIGRFVRSARDLLGALRRTAL